MKIFGKFWANVAKIFRRKDFKKILIKTFKNLQKIFEQFLPKTFLRRFLVQIF